MFELGDDEALAVARVAKLLLAINASGEEVWVQLYPETRSALSRMVERIDRGQRDMGSPPRGR
jgi:hypothetical protein